MWPQSEQRQYTPLSELIVIVVSWLLHTGQTSHRPERMSRFRGGGCCSISDLSNFCEAATVAEELMRALTLCFVI